MKKIISFALSIIMILSLTVFAGCGNDNKPGNPDGKGDPNGSYDGKVTEITVCDLILSATGKNRWKAMRQQQFEKDHPEIKVNHISSISGDTTNMVEYLTTIFMGDSSPAFYEERSLQLRSGR